jgi:hypothetical protein
MDVVSSDSSTMELVTNCGAIVLNGTDPTKVIVSIPVFDLLIHARITSECRFHLIYSYTYLDLFLRGQSMQVHDLTKYE